MLASAASATTQPAFSAGYATGPGPYLLMGLFVTLVGVIVLVWIFHWTARLIVTPPRLTPARALGRLGRSSPGDVGLPFEDLTFTVPDVSGGTISLPAWFIPAGGPTLSTRTAIIVHAFGDSRSGALAWVWPWRAMGFNVLLFDLRAHGEAGGQHSGGGVWEADDLLSIMAELNATRPRATEHLAIHGISFGSLVTAMAAARAGDGTPKPVILVLDSPIPSFASSAAAFANVAGLPLAGLTRLRLRWMSKRLGVDLLASDTLKSIEAADVATLAIVPMQDILLGNQREQFVSGLDEQGVAVWEPDCPHNLAIAEFPVQYAALLRKFLDQRVTR